MTKKKENILTVQVSFEWNNIQFSVKIIFHGIEGLVKTVKYTCLV